MLGSTPSGSYVDACAAAFRRRVTAEQKAATDRAAELRGRAQAAARKLAEECGASRVWLFGSLAWGQAHAASDVDLLVEGLPAEAWSMACALVEAEAQAPVDLVRVEEAGPELVARVRGQGVLLHGAR
jgi:predicted nucleotidyltransferase